MFRALRADEVEVRVAQCFDKGCTVLLYKDARCDMNILDETVGNMSWKREHSRDNANCTVSIWNQETSQWVSKEDTGTESNTEAQKGLASDSFKRACVNWGIGRELYTAPRIFISKDKCRMQKNDKSGKWMCRDRFHVSDMNVEDGRITFLKIVNDSTGRLAFTYSIQGKEKPAEKQAEKPQRPQRDRLVTAVTKYCTLMCLNRNMVLNEIKNRDDYEDTEEFYAWQADEFEAALKEVEVDG